MSDNDGPSSGEKKIQYWEIVRQSFLMTWQNKFLWIFGLFIFVGSLPSSINASNSHSHIQSQYPQNMLYFVGRHPVLSAIIIFSIIVSIVIFFVLRLLGSASLIKSANNIAVYGQSTIGAIFSETRKYLKKLLILEVITIAAVVVIAITLFVPVAYLFALNSDILAGIFFAVALIIIIPLLILVYYIRRYAYMYIILGEMTVKMSLDAAYVLLEKSLKKSLLAGCVAIILNIAIWLVVFVATAILSLFIAPFAFAFYLIFAKTGLMMILLLGALLLIVTLLTIFSWFEAILQAFWVLFFQQISLEKQEEKKVLEKLEVDGKIPTPEPV